MKYSLDKLNNIVFTDLSTMTNDEYSRVLFIRSIICGIGISLCTVLLLIIPITMGLILSIILFPANNFITGCPYNQTRDGRHCVHGSNKELYSSCNLVTEWGFVVCGMTGMILILILITIIYLCLILPTKRVNYQAI